MKQEIHQPCIADQYDALLAFEPKLIRNYVPANAIKQKQAFLDEKIRNPDHTYPELDAIDFEATAASIEDVGQQILHNPALNPKYALAYEQFIESYLKKTRLMALARMYKTAQDSYEKEQVRHEFMALNIELYGVPSEVTYRSLLQEKLNAISQKSLTGTALELQHELFNIVGFDASIEKLERFRPSDETVEWMQGVVATLYSGMLFHVPHQEKLSKYEMQTIFTAIIREEFGEAAKDWKVDIEPAKSVNVKPTEKRIVIPDDMNDRSRKVVRQLVVHEIGVHMLRTVMGSETDLDPLRVGLNGYYDAEEGLGKVMEQALYGTFAEAGVDHYITTGMAYHDHNDFRGTFERKWRLGALSSLQEGEEVTNDNIAKAKVAAYNSTMRIMRGTDELPWFKDLSYYNGSIDMWRHLEAIRGDDIKFMFVLMGKANPADMGHQRIMYETATV